MDTHVTYNELADFITGRLEKEREERISVHLKECAQCGKMMENMQWAKRHLLSLSHRLDEEHPDPELVLGYLRRELEPEVAEWVESDGLAPTETLNKHTEEGTIIGTAAYMSPEQAQGKRADACSDIFSFGAVLYEMVTSRRAFQGDSKLSTLAAIINQEPAPLPAEIPHDLEKLITRCLRKDPERRFQHMDDVKVALEELKEESDSGRLLMAASRATQRWRFSHWAVALGAGALLAAAGLWLWRTRAEAPAVAFGAVPLTTYTGMESQPSFSPDGNQVAFVWDGAQQDNFDIYIKQIGTENLLRLTRDPAVDSSPAWSPDGRHVAFLRALPGNRAGVFLVPTIGGPECKLAETCLPSFVPEPFLGWSPDGKWLAITDRSSAEEPFGLFLLSIETGEKRRLTSAAGQNARRQRTRVLSQWPKPGFRSDR